MIIGLSALTIIQIIPKLVLQSAVHVTRWRTTIIVSVHFPSASQLLLVCDCASMMLTYANSCKALWFLPPVALISWSGLHSQLSVISTAYLLSLTSNISVPSPPQTRSELIIAPPPPWPFASCERATPQQPSTTVVAAFITPKQPNVPEQIDVKKPSSESISSSINTEKPPLAKPEPEPDFDDVIFESPNQRQESRGLFLEEDDSKHDTIKRCPPGWVFIFKDAIRNNYFRKQMLRLQNVKWWWRWYTQTEK